MIKGRNSKENTIIQNVYKADQDHIFRWWEELNDTSKDKLIKQLEQIDFNLLDDLKKLEQSCLREIRKFADSKNNPSKSLLDLLCEYDRLVAGDRKGTRERIERTLYDRPWQKCTCAICRKLGIEVVIFRGNNRNRRRGFHNVFVFYGVLDRAISGEEFSFINKKELANQGALF